MLLTTVSTVGEDTFYRILSEGEIYNMPCKMPKQMIDVTAIYKM
jgi:hypothetical protein